ncbi:unnamed protein product [Bursaphelenchus okinawaensis]|uniref:Uncharacterized protein n=1 Tax=Bursaphelenchus okinawaensis TaxID=465554 RepID=A0A811KGI7_9BILA|nr:unnamed protein product [Bursaphelenchus okinawaensis]CAG9104020.1 unnamed protein product [Bursaphelenchus okinawaensis]
MLLYYHYYHFLARSESCPRRLSKQYAFGSSTPRDWSHQQKVPYQHRIYDAKGPPKIRSQTIHSFNGSMRSVASSFTPAKAATSRESRPRLPRPNLPPAPSTSRQVRPSRADDDDASSEPDIKMHQESLKQWAKEQPSITVKQDDPTTRTQANNVKNEVKEPKPEPQKKEPSVVNQVHETENELIFEKSEDLRATEKLETVHPSEELHDFNMVVKKKVDAQIAQPKLDKIAVQPNKTPEVNHNNGTVPSDN